MTSQPLAVLLVSDQRQAIRETSRFLDALGYRIHGAVDMRQALAAIETGRPDIVIIDEALSAQSMNELSDRIAHLCGDVYSFLMAKAPDTTRIVNALKAGFDDFLSKPIVFGELLARLRAGTRVLEHRRHLKRQHGADPVTGLPSRDAFGQKLKWMLQTSRDHSTPLSCVSLNLDFFSRFGNQYGQPFSHHTLKVVAKALTEFVRASEPIACEGGDQFFAAIEGATEKEGARWAERLRATLADNPLQVDDIAVGVTASVGVAACEGEQIDEKELIQRALEAQTLAKGSGRNCVVRYSQLHDDARSWASLATPGKLFATTCARDVMTACPVVLRRDDAIDKAQVLFRKSQLKVVPVVDGIGTFVGHVTKSKITEGRGDDRVRDVLDTSARCLDERTGFAVLIDLFTHDSRSLVFVAREGRPIGLITCGSLAALSDPLDTSCLDTDTVDDD